MAIRAVCFDLFETLVTEFQDGRRSAKRNVNYEAVLGLPNATFKEEWAGSFAQRMRGDLADFPSAIRSILDRHQLPYPAEAVARLQQERIEEKRVPFQSIHPNVLAMLAQLRERGMKLCLISNCTEEEVQSWEGCALAPYFDHVVLSYKTGMAKPEPGIYGLGSELLQVPPEQIVFVGDGGADELAGAARAGMTSYHALWFNDRIESPYPKLLTPKDLFCLLPT